MYTRKTNYQNWCHICIE